MRELVVRVGLTTGGARRRRVRDRARRITLTAERQLHSESAEQQEELLRTWRIRDRERCAAQTAAESAGNQRVLRFGNGGKREFKAMNKKSLKTCQTD